MHQHSNRCPFTHLLVNIVVKKQNIYQEEDAAAKEKKEEVENSVRKKLPGALVYIIYLCGTELQKDSVSCSHGIKVEENGKIM